MSELPQQRNEGLFESIVASLPREAGSVLDVGAQLGYFCQRFEASGFRCTAYEEDPEHVYFMRGLRDSEQREFEIRDQSILDTTGALNFDVILALNVLHHFISSPPLYDGLRRLLPRLQAKCMLFQPHHPGDTTKENSYLNFTPEEIVQFLLDQTVFTHQRQIGVDARGRPLYLLTR